MLTRRNILSGGLAVLSAPARTSHPAFAQSKYPERPIRLVIPYPPGGVNDAIGRPWAEKMKSPLGTVVVENIGGGGGLVGTTAVVRAQPDGYTILLANNSILVVNPIASTRRSYDPVKDFEPIALLIVNCLAFAVHPSLPVRTLQELIDYAKSNPGKLSYGSAGIGTGNHLTGELLKSLTGTDIVHVPYRGAGPAISDLIGGQIPMAVAVVTGQVIGLHAAGKLRMLAVTGERRLVAAPDVPTAVEAGVPGLVSQGFQGLFAPAGTPPPIIEQISLATRVAMADDDMQQRMMVASGFEPQRDTTPDKTRRFVAAEITRWAPIIKGIGLKLD